ncbi:phasin family protein [Massilia antarctica]|uniref:phasin family protein n=1 Tax=Massilia antarctica TaxID=2765360 RepID=UPI0006BB77EE|nr:phasin family protein [Massilia sp. H27-R4]MCY0911173.1 phasin family protein [Massilia sp. H27-R4]CUI05240.1 granule-associated protein [Janthinobacterium sp. CG23_2]CUU29026.1 granule-associated protein [Janthinobacterium sp. CG23_2]
MSNLPEQFSAARKAQLEAQFDAFRHFSGKAVENTEKLIALNLRTTRASVEKSTAAFQQLLAAKDPRDLLALTAHSRESFNTILDYGRALFGIAGSVSAEAAKVSALSAPAVARASANDEAHGDDGHYDEQTSGDKIEAAGSDAPAEPDTDDEPIIVSMNPIGESDPDPLPLADATPIARAIAGIGAGASQDAPSAAPLAADDAIQIDVSGIRPIDTTPPPAPHSGRPVMGKPADASGSKGARKK